MLVVRLDRWLPEEEKCFSAGLLLAAEERVGVMGPFTHGIRSSFFT